MRLRCGCPLLVVLAVSAALGGSLIDNTELAAEPHDKAVKYEVSIRDVSVDGKDGKPHEGPFVETSGLRKQSSDTAEKESPAILSLDKKMMDTKNFGVMQDPNRPEPRKGTTGTSGGVSEKDRVRKEREGVTGTKAGKKPEIPKQAPHSEQEKLTDRTKDKAKEREGEKVKEDVIGLEKPANLPGKTHDKAPPIPDSADKNHLDVSKGGKVDKKVEVDSDGDEGLIRPLHSFLLSLTMILFSEVGDKTFLVAALMAMKHDRLVVFSAAFSALITMTVLSAVLGHAVPTLIPKRITNLLAAGLFLVFGARLLREGLAMSRDVGVSEEMREVELELEEKELKQQQNGSRRRSSVSPYTLEMGLADRKSRSKSRFPAPPRSPSSSPEARSPSPHRGNLAGVIAGLHNLLSLLLSPAWVQTFVMTFLGEWGDRSQIATIAMAAGQDYWWVTLGAVLGHGCCTGVAVVGGRAIAGRVSLKVVTVGGAIAFLVFGLIYLMESFFNS